MVLALAQGRLSSPLAAARIVGYVLLGLVAEEVAVADARDDTPVSDIAKLQRANRVFSWPSSQASRRHCCCILHQPSPGPASATRPSASWFRELDDTTRQRVIAHPAGRGVHHVPRVVQLGRPAAAACNRALRQSPAERARPP
jgi:hypothetical protein